MENCECKVLDREDGETQREWLKRCMCMYHWMCTDYYQRKLPLKDRRWEVIIEVTIP